MVDLNVEDVLFFLSEWRTRKELEARFLLTNTESFNYLRWLENGGYITCIRGNYATNRRTNKLYLYKKVHAPPPVLLV